MSPPLIGQKSDFNSDVAHEPRQAEIGFSFARAYQGQGFATEAVGRLLDYLFDVLNLHRVIAITDADNRAAARLLERLGLRREGTFVENVWFKGAWGSEFSYALLHREWAKKDRFSVFTRQTGVVPQVATD